MHKMRYFLPPLPDYAPGTCDLYHPKLRLVALPRECLRITYDFEAYTKPILEAMCKNVGQQLVVRKGYVIVPVHELQVVHIRDKFKEAEIYSEAFSLSLLAQQSIRLALDRVSLECI